MMKPVLATGLAAVTFALLGCAQEQPGAYTLYRNSVAIEAARLHVATFDASYSDDEMKDYNRENCEKARGLFQNQEGVRTRFWCEKGHFREWARAQPPTRREA